MPRKSTNDLTMELFAAQRRAMLLATDPEWQVNNRTALDLDIATITAPFVVAVKLTSPGSLRRLAGFRCASVEYRARYTTDTLLLFTHDPQTLAASLPAAARNDGVTIRLAYGPFDRTHNSIPTP